MTMTFKEALIAHLQGEKVEVLSSSAEYQGTITGDDKFRPFADYYRDVKYSTLLSIISYQSPVFRIKPRTILVNGVEVPAPEKDAPADDAEYFVPHCLDRDSYEAFYWAQDELDARLLERGLVYLDKESAIARAKAMLITKEVK